MTLFSSVVGPAAAEPASEKSVFDWLGSADPKLVAGQERLMGFKSWVVGVPGIFDAGFVESANHAESVSTTVLWAGESPLRQTVREEADRRGITLTFKPVRHSRKALQEGADRIWASAGDAAWNGFVVTSLTGTDLTTDGLVVRGFYQGGQVNAARQARTAEVAKGLSAVVTGVQEAPKPTNYVTRSTDTSPFNAGGAMRGSNGSLCSSGFGLSIGNVWRTTTARHCTAGTYAAWDNGAQSYGGTLTHANGAGARILTGAGFRWMFDGAWNDPNGYLKTVQGYADLSINDWVCTSGANTGVHCGLQVDNLLIAYNDGFGVFWTIRAHQRQGGIAGGQGDSGGPVLVPYANGKVGAAGMIQGSLGPQTTACGSVRVGGIVCGTELEFSSTRTIAQEVGGVLLTG
ncbi:hypothetical protein ACFWNN_42135 [Lentzea sp. NPDC058450]|uniref:hypothetical protein n=1 Tax=Lentzea sp. NPDC058450 TaxID=3346505 RepID=UPI00364AF609